VIPDSGILRVKGDGPFYGWHRLKASFVNGDIIPIGVETGADELGGKAVALWGGESRTDNRIYHFVGTASEFVAFSKESAAGPIKLGEVQRKAGE
jgi:hypothetical protein